MTDKLFVSVLVVCFYFLEAGGFILGPMFNVNSVSYLQN